VKEREKMLKTNILILNYSGWGDIIKCLALIQEIDILYLSYKKLDNKTVNIPFFYFMFICLVRVKGTGVFIMAISRGIILGICLFFIYKRPKFN
jgi:hypothetical protein